jgi:hypothetical protein
VQFVIWQGFDHQWQRESHRLNRFGSVVDVSDAHGFYTSIMQIGRFPPDRCHTYAMLHPIYLPDGGLISGQVAATLEGSLGERVEAAGEPITHRLPDRDLAATVIMRGFDIECANFSHGFHTRGFGFHLDQVSLSGDELTFVPRFFIHPDKSPDPFTDPDRALWRILPLPASVEPNTPDTFAYRMTVYYMIVYAHPDRLIVSPPTGDKTLRLSYRGPSSTRRRLVSETLSGQPGDYRFASVGIRGISWELHDWARTRFRGRYLRRLAGLIDGMHYDVQTSQMQFNARLEFTNIGGRQGRDIDYIKNPFFRILRRLTETEKEHRQRSFRANFGFHAEHRLTVTLLQFGKGAANHPPIRPYNLIRRTNPTVSRRFSLAVKQVESVN